MLYGDRRLDAGMWIVADDLKIFEFEIIDRIDLPFDHQFRKRLWFAGKDEVDLFEVVVVDVAVSARPDELAWLKSHDMRDHLRQQRVRGDIERNAEKGIATALI